MSSAKFILEICTKEFLKRSSAFSKFIIVLASFIMTFDLLQLVHHGLNMARRLQNGRGKKIDGILEIRYVLRTRVWTLDPVLPSTCLCDLEEAMW